MVFRSLITLTTEDFEGRKLSSICRYPDVVVLFHNEQKESVQLYDLLASSVNSTVSNAFFGALNIIEHPNVMRDMVNGDGAYYEFRIQGVPQLVKFRNREPVGVYNGLLTTETLSNYILTVASRDGYREPSNVYSGVTVDDDFELPGKKPYLNTSEQPNLVAHNSFDLSEDIRGYDTKPGLVKRGTKEEGEALNTLRADIAPPLAVPSTPTSVTSSAPVNRRAKKEESPKVAQVRPPVTSVPSSTSPSTVSNEPVSVSSASSASKPTFTPVSTSQREAVEPSGR